MRLLATDALQVLAQCRRCHQERISSSQAGEFYSYALPYLLPYSIVFLLTRTKSQTLQVAYRDPRVPENGATGPGKFSLAPITPYSNTLEKARNHYNDTEFYCSKLITCELMRVPSSVTAFLAGKVSLLKPPSSPLLSRPTLTT